MGGRVEVPDLGADPDRQRVGRNDGYRPDDRPAAGERTPKVRGIVRGGGNDTVPRYDDTLHVVHLSFCRAEDANPPPALRALGNQPTDRLDGIDDGSETA